MINKLEIGGPGFINIYPSIISLRERASELLLDENYGIKQEPPLSVIIDYGGANVAKPMHVGHLRSAVIGESIKRILRAQGHNVIGDVHMGDWGLQMGHLISELQIEQPNLTYFDENITSGFSDTSPVTIDDLARLYPQASVAA
jgi:arginyl-tRNA synthetase